MTIKERILDTVTGYAYIPMTPGELYDYLNEDGSLDEGEFWRAVQEMEGEDFSIVFTKKNKLVSAENVGQYKGLFSSSAKGGFGFVTTDKEEFFVPPALTFCAINGDTVICRRLDRSSRYFGKGNEAEVVAVIDRGVQEIIGTLTVYNSGKGKSGHLNPNLVRVEMSVPWKALGVEPKAGVKVPFAVRAYQSEFDQMKAYDSDAEPCELLLK